MRSKSAVGETRWLSARTYASPGHTAQHILCFIMQPQQELMSASVACERLRLSQMILGHVPQSASDHLVWDLLVLCLQD